MKLSDIFSKFVVTAGPEDTLNSIALLMEEHNVGMVVIVEGRHPIGLVTDRDLALALGARRFPADTPAGAVMARQVLAIPDDADVFAATQYIRECGVRRLPIVDKEDCIVGVVTLDDLVRYLGTEIANLATGIKREMEVL